MLTHTMQQIASQNAMQDNTAEAFYPITLLYDASCPVCNLEMDNLKARNHAQRLMFVDASASAYDADTWGVAQAEAMALMHAVCANGRIVKGVEVFHLAYAAVGLAWVTAATRWWGIRQFLNWLYPIFARNRNRFSARYSGVILRIAARRALRRSQACHDGLCANHAATNPESKKATS